MNMENEIKGKMGEFIALIFLPDGVKSWEKSWAGWWRRLARLAPGEERVGFCFGKADSRICAYLKKILDNYYGKAVKEVSRENGCIHLSYHSRFFARFFASLGVKPVSAGEKRVPPSLFTATEEAVAGFLRGLFSADGTARFSSGKSAYVRLTSRSLKLLQEVQLLLLNLGIKCSLYDRHRKPRYTFPYVSQEGAQRRYYSDGILYELQISRDSLPLFLNKVGFLCGKHAQTISCFNNQSFYTDRFMEEVVEIIPLGEEMVYDLEEPVTNSFIANGIVVHNCGEQPFAL